MTNNNISTTIIRHLHQKERFWLGRRDLNRLSWDGEPKHHKCEESGGYPEGQFHYPGRWHQYQPAFNPVTTICHFTNL
jgi:hypothetical protein